MTKVKTFYSSGEMAKLAGINKRTLHYYNDIGLFCPDKIGDNGFHYYSCFQCAKLEMILMLRKIGFSIEDIKQYINNPSEESFSLMVGKKSAMIDKSINELIIAKSFLERKADKLDKIKNVDCSKVEMIKLPKQKILLSNSISGNYDDEDFAVASEFSFRLKTLFGLYDNFGSRISVENIFNGKYSSYSSFFAYANKTAKVYDDIMTEGIYLRAYHIGRWSHLKYAYDRLLSFAHDNNLVLSGYCYEEGLNEMTLRNSDDYVTMITVACKQIEEEKFNNG